MQRDLLNGRELLGDIDSFTDEQRKARQTFIEQELHLPRSENRGFIVRLPRSADAAA